MIKSPAQVATALAALAAALYGRHLGDAYLSDDYLYLAWAEQGLTELLRRVTVDSAPQMLRPLPALPWLLGRFEHGAVLLHALGVALHALAGFLVARIAWLRQKDAGWHGPLLFGALFVAFPLLAEPVVWLSSGFDRLATCAALLALERALAWLPAGEEPFSWRTVAITSGLFLAALLSKESVLLLPVIAFTILPRRTAWRLAAAWGSVVVASLVVRLLVFGGLGGYAAPGGGSLSLAIDLRLFARNVFLQLPFRLLVPLKNAWAWEFAPAIAALSALLFLVLALGMRRPRATITALAAMILALLPAAPIFSIDVDHENSRLLYFPAALLAALGARAFAATTTRWRAAAIGLLVLWSACTWSNASAWREASREVRTTLNVLAEIEGRAPPGATVLVAGHDTWRGVMVWRNGLAIAARRAGLRRDVDWRFGTAAVLEDPARLGVDAFEISIWSDHSWIDWTPCQLALKSAPAHLLARTPPAPAAGMTRQLPWIDLEPIVLKEIWIEAVAIVARRPLDQEVNGRLWWRGAGERFRVTNSRAFSIATGQSRSIVRLPRTFAGGQQIGLRLQLSDPRQLATLLELRGVETPEACAAVSD